MNKILLTKNGPSLKTQGVDMEANPDGIWFDYNGNVNGIDSCYINIINSGDGDIEIAILREEDENGDVIFPDDLDYFKVTAQGFWEIPPAAFISKLRAFVKGGSQITILH